MTEFEKVQRYLSDHQHTWLVTGAAGFIGSNIVASLLRFNQKVIALDNFATGYRHNVEAVLEGVSPEQRACLIMIEGDIRSYETCEQAVKGVDYVLHQAALGSVPRSIENPVNTNATNVDGFVNMFFAAAQAGSVRRFVYASSSSVYGDSPVLPKVEDHIGNPLSPYAVSKYTNELYGQTFPRCYGVESIGLRYFNVFGAYQDPNSMYSAVIPLWVSALIQGKEVYINGDGETSRDFCYIDNVVQMNLLSALTDNPEAVNQVYNVAVGERTTLNTLYDLLCKNMNISGRKPIYRDFRSGDVRHSLANISKAKTLLGYAPTHSIATGLPLAVKWYVANLDKLQK